MTVLWIVKLHGLMFHPERAAWKRQERFLRKWNTYKCLPEVLWFWRYTSLNVNWFYKWDYGSLWYFFLPYDWLESNNSFPNELKERRINCHFPKHVLSFSWTSWSNWFLSSSSWAMQSSQNVALHFVLSILTWGSDCSALIPFDNKCLFWTPLSRVK